MLKKVMLLILGGCFLGHVSALAAPKVTQAMKDQLKADIKVIEAWVQDAVIVDAVKAQNKEGLSLDEIKKRDAAWIKAKKAKKKTALMKETLSHKAGKWLLQKNKDSRGSYPEAFLCDNQGANVAVSKLTSDYWQGDEAKWKKPFHSGDVMIGEPEYDPSSKAMQVQVSVPVKSGGSVIGVLVVGVKLSSLK